MRWRGRRRSSNVEDRRGSGGGFPGGGIRIPVGGRGAGIGGIGLVVLVVLAVALGVDPRLLLQGGIPGEPGPGDRTAERTTTMPPQDEAGEFVSVVLADTEETWRELFREMDGTYAEPSLVLFDGVVRSACGMAQSAMGPFYCPADQKVYIDLSFYHDLRDRLGAPGDFAQAYVIAHEVGHHVQTLMGITERVHQIRQRLSPADGNALSVRLELQADCLAGVWAHHADRARNLLESGDIEEGLNAAAAIGDDRLQRQSQGYVVPESFTHGTSAQRVGWFKRGLDEGDPGACDTFSTSERQEGF